jgi:hypothetical protein
MSDPPPRPIVCDAGVLASDVETVELLARLQLAAQRRGEQMLVVGVAPALRALLDLCGLCEVLHVEMRRELEERE